MSTNLARHREFIEADVWAAYRSLKMGLLSAAELRDLYRRHRATDMFASKVIVEAASQALALRCLKVEVR